MRHSTIVERLSETLAEWTNRGIIDPVTEDEICNLIEAYEKCCGEPVSDRVEHAGAQWVEAKIAFRVLENREIALTHAPDRIIEYDSPDSYPGLIEEYVELTDDLLDGIEYEISGDWSAGEDAHIMLELDDQCVEGTVEYNQDVVEFSSFLKLLNKLVETATDDPRRFRHVFFNEASIVFVKPDHADYLSEYFDDAYGSRSDL